MCLQGSHYLWSLFFINSLRSEMHFVRKIFSNSHSDCFNNGEKHFFSVRGSFLGNLVTVDVSVISSLHV